MSESYDKTVVALLGPRADATCSSPACGEPDPCQECEHRRHLHAEEEERQWALARFGAVG